jgi:pyruvate dehydrogenase E2 component (dihydrolipoamide acetyltransferase)
MDVKLPNLGEGADSGTVVNLLVKPGETLAPGQGIVELENEKAVATIPAPSGGVVGEIFVKVGDRVTVGQRLISLADAQAAPTKSSAPTGLAPRKPASEPKPEPQAAADDGAPPEADLPPRAPGADPVASPSIRQLARELGIDLSRVRPGDGSARIRLEDVRAYLGQLQRQSAAPKSTTPGAPAAPATAPVDFSKWGEISRKPMSMLGKVVARRMAENWNAVPHVTQFDEADITGPLALLKKFGPAYEAKGTRLTLTSLVLKAVATTLQKHPLFNSSLDEAAHEIVLKQYIHLGLAVDTEAGLIVPVIRDADKKSVLELSQAIDEAARKARDRKVTPEELKGGTFTISNQGAIGGAHFTPIVNRPEVAILGLGRGALKPVVREKQVVARVMLPLAVSYDHRVINGADAARFTIDLVAALENFTEADAAI